ncbi:ABC transporter ATP-binding protein [Nocardioides sp.]|uniref:ABC transporter ATP-binding protein n=1 Tax=Nocardioides sp. TaxID=35761 RepID=UPI002B60D22B|nr:ABC transporter ATP-binding protein [Nocardioides sp.]HSX68745.1 ABC transporter ATP-binding protein [Nocardioides sp.]
MTDVVVEAVGLRKSYSSLRGGRSWAVDGANLRVERGQVHGFLGPNGSGKTSTIRMLLGLSRADTGTMSLFGTTVPAHLPEVMARVGAVVESPRFSPGLTGRQNLLLLSRSVGVADTRVDEALHTVGLGDRGRHKYKGYSLGMRQRLAVAATLLRDPELLILDEPSNGLDPAGIRENREMIRSLAARGVTVLLSSHVLAEVQQVCTDVTILGRGRTIASGSVDELLAGGDGVRVVTTDPTLALSTLVEAGVAARLDGPALNATGTAPERISELLAGVGVWIKELTPERRDLESVFLELTAGEDLSAQQSAQQSAPTNGAA